MPILTLIVPFEVPGGQEDEFRQQWHNVAEPLSHAPGFLSARLYEVNAEVEEYVRQLPNMKWVGGQRFRFVNIAEWESLSHYQAALQSSRQNEPIAFPSYPAYYRLYGGGNTNSSERTRTGQEFTFIVPFEVPEEQEEEMRRQFQAIIAALGKSQPVEGSWGPGLYELDPEADAQMREFLSAQLREGQNARPEFRFVNVAEWASLENYGTVMRSPHRLQAKPITFPGYGAYYRIAAEYIRRNG